MVSHRTKKLALLGLGLGMGLALIACVSLAQPPTPSPTPPPTATPTPLPTPTATPAVEASDCPTDPQQWELVEYAPERGLGNLRGIMPPCVYDQIGRTAAWVLLLGMGYTKPEATAALGFTENPDEMVGAITVTTNMGTGLVVKLLYMPNHPDFRQWAVDSKGQPVSWIVLRGCFSGAVYQHPWPVICEAWMGRLDQRYFVATLGEIYATSVVTKPQGINDVYPIYFGYTGQGRWVYLGAMKHLTEKRGYYVLFDDPE